MMDQSELAWIALEYVNGRKQVDIADELGVTPTVISTAIMRFCEKCGFPVEFKIYGEERRDFAHKALQNYHGQFIRPTKQLWIEALWAARNEHAWLLRAEGFTLREIGERLGVSVERIRQMIRKQGRRMKRAMRHTSFITIIDGVGKHERGGNA